MSQKFSTYHAHVYCTHDERELCNQIRSALLAAVPEIAVAGPVRARPVGPHPLPMFEAWFDGDYLDKVTDWLAAHRGHLSVLIHPLSGSEIDDHTKYAKWLGTPQPLDLTIFD
jgi:aromatic ring-cleaving dioxygenase